jgi:ATP-dependent Clp protease ATP-binding subunit ClpA
MQLEAQLADRAVTIELTEEARLWLIEHGYDQAMGARPMSRIIQQTIKTPLADEVLFGRLKTGGTVRVVVREDEGKKTLGFEFPQGPVLPRPDKEVVESTKKKVRPEPEVRRAKAKAVKPATPASDGGEPKGKGGGRTVPKVPLKN